MGSKQLRNLALHMKDSLFKQGYLDEQFNALEELEDAENPNFVEEIANSFLNDSLRQMNNIQQILEKRPIDFNKLEMHIYRFTSGCSSIGAAKVMDEASKISAYCGQGNSEGCMRAFQQLKIEVENLETKLEPYFQLLRQARSAEASNRPK